jgi:hypothetical protein
MLAAQCLCQECQTSADIANVGNCVLHLFGRYRLRVSPRPHHLVFPSSTTHQSSLVSQVTSMAGATVSVTNTIIGLCSKDAVCFLSSRVLSPQANYTDSATATCRRNLVPTFVDRGVSRGRSGGCPTAVNLIFLDRSHYLSFK